MKTEIQGVISALVTPFIKGEVDYESLKKLVDYQVQNGIHGLVVNGTTAESPTLTSSEVYKIFSAVREIVGPQFPLILGTGSNSTFKTIEDTKKAAELGAQAALVVVPYYNKPPQKGLVQHFTATAQATKLPIILYNVPGRTITALAPESILELSKIENIIGVKEASGDLKQDADLFSKLRKDFLMLSGDDPTYLDFLQLGGHGVISVMSNILTAESVRWTQQMRTGETAKARADFQKYSKLIQQMYCEANPIPLKWMLYKKGLMKSPELRLPLTALDEKFHDEIGQEMKSLGLL